MNKQIRRLGVGLLACYVLLFVQLNVLQVVRADSYNANPLNTRQVVRDFSRPRGVIQTADGVILAQSVPSNDRVQLPARVPDEGSLRRHHRVLRVHLRQRRRRAVVQRRARRAHRPAARDQLELVLRGQDHDRRRHAQPARRRCRRWRRTQLGDRQGSVVALDPRDGAILATWSFPSYDPNLLATHDFKAADAARQALLAAPGKPLVPATYRERYFPGSTFKVVTSSAGLQSGQVTPTSPVLPGGRRATRRPSRRTRSRTSEARRAVARSSTSCAVSCNSAFAQMGVDLGPEVMVGQAQAVRVQLEAADRPPGTRGVVLPARRRSSTTTRRRSRSPRSGRTTCRRRRCRWRSSRRASRTAA